MSAQAYTPLLLNQINTFNKYKQESIIIYVPVAKYLFVIRNNNPKLFSSRSAHSSGPALRVWALPSTTLTNNKMPDNAQQAVYHSLPNRQGFRGQRTNLGNVHKLFNIDMNLLRHIYQEARNMEVMWSLHAFTIWIIYPKIPIKSEGLVLVNLSSQVMALNLSLDMNPSRR